MALMKSKIIMQNLRLLISAILKYLIIQIFKLAVMAFWKKILKTWHLAAACVMMFPILSGNQCICLMQARLSKLLFQEVRQAAKFNLKDSIILTAVGQEALAHHINCR